MQLSRWRLARVLAVLLLLLASYLVLSNVPLEPQVGIMSDTGVNYFGSSFSLLPLQGLPLRLAAQSGRGIAIPVRLLHQLLSPQGGRVWSPSCRVLLYPFGTASAGVRWAFVYLAFVNTLAWCILFVFTTWLSQHRRTTSSPEREPSAREE
jgi:hypothetical protein